MARIDRIEWFMVDLKPKTTRTEAIHIPSSQPPPIVRITDSYGVVGTGYSYTIGRGGPSATTLIEHTMAPAFFGRKAHSIDAIWHDLLFLKHATTVGPVTAIAMAAIDTAFSDLRCRHVGSPLHRSAGGAQAWLPLRRRLVRAGWVEQASAFGKTKHTA